MYLGTSIIDKDSINVIVNNESIDKSFCVNGNYYRIEIHKDNRVNLNRVTIYEWDNDSYQLKLDGECQIESQLDGTNKIIMTRLISTDRNTDIFYFKGQNDGEFIKSVYCKNDFPIPSKYVIEQSNTTCQNEFERLCNQQYYDESKCVLIIKVNGIGKPQITKNKNGIEFINNILKQQVQKSDGFNYGLFNQLNYSRVILKCQHINNIRLFQELGKEYFNQLTNLNDFLQDFGLELLQQNDPSKQNFATIPVCTDGHISTLLFDLRPNISEQISERLYSFDSSLCHYGQNIFSDLLAEDHKLSAQSLQLTGCCGYWTSCFIEECSKIKDIEEIKKQFKTGEMQLKVACKVSEIIDMNRHQHNIGFIKQIHLPLQIANETSSDEYEASDFIEIKIKDTNKCFLLDRKKDRENICKSTCVDIEAIYNLTQQKNSQLIISDNDLAKLKEQTIKQNQELFNIKQKRIEEIKKQIEPINEILEIKLEIYKLNNLHHEKLAMLNNPQSVKISDTPINIDTLNKLFCNNLAKLEYLKNKFFSGAQQQYEYLSKQIMFKGDNSEEYQKEYQLYDNNYKTFNSYNNAFNKYHTYKENLQQLFPDLKEYFEQQQRYYNQLLLVEQLNMKNAQNDYYQISKVNQSQLDKVNGCISEMGKSLNKNLSNSTSKTAQLTGQK